MKYYFEYTVYRLQKLQVKIHINHRQYVAVDAMFDSTQKQLPISSIPHTPETLQCCTMLEINENSLLKKLQFSTLRTFIS